MWRVWMFAVMALAFFGAAGWYTHLVIDVGGPGEDPGNTWGCLMSYILALACVAAAVVSVKQHSVQSKEFAQV
jgi:hypothetical protein